MCNNNNSNCGCGCNSNNNGGLFSNCNEWIIILVVLFVFCNCGGCSLFSGNSGGCGCNNGGCNNGGCGCDNGCGC